VSLSAKDRELVVKPSVTARLNFDDLLAEVSEENLHSSIDTGSAVGETSGCRQHAQLFASISNSRAIRNLLAHDHGAIDDESVFGIVYSDLIVLQAEVAEPLQKLTSAN
jgi:hypothetical protein